MIRATNSNYLKLRHINNASGILFIIKRLRVIVIVSNRVVKYRLSIVIFGMADLNTFKITGLAVLVG